MASERQRIAGSLAALATFGLALAPVLHAQLHAAEVEQEHDRAISEMFQVAFDQARGPGWSGALADAVAQALRGRDRRGSAVIEPGHSHGRQKARHHHSHGQGRHAAGSLEHLAFAVHAASDAPAVTDPVRVPVQPARAPITLHLTPRYLVPDFSQGPPRA